MEKEPTGLGQSLKKIGDEGFPSEKTMRGQLDNIRAERVADGANQYLQKYNELFEKWKKGETSEVETKEMFALGEQLKSIADKIV